MKYCLNITMSDKQQQITLDNESEPVEISNMIQVPEKEEDINMNLNSQEHNVVENVLPTKTKEKTAPEDNNTSESSFPFDTLEFIKFILFRILNIIYSRFFDVVNDFSSVYSEATGKLK